MAMPRLSPNQFAITYEAETNDAPPPPTPNSAIAAASANGELAWLASSSPAPAVATPAAITARAPMRSTNHPATGVKSPIATATTDMTAERRARLHPKCFSNGANRTAIESRQPTTMAMITNSTATINQP